MDPSSYRRPPRLARLGLGLTLISTLALALGGCKKDRGGLGDQQRGKLRRIAENLEEAYARTPLPNLSEPPSLQERVDKWDDFRACTVRTYVARKRDADRRAREGRPRDDRHASIGDETVEECGVQMAIADKDATICERLALDYPGPSGELGLPAARCWDTRARVFGLPDECPVVWLPWDAPGRNPECLALARRDQSLCAFADSPGRCRALLTGDSGSCGARDSAPDCILALEYWQGLIPLGFNPPLWDEKAHADKPLSASFDLKWQDNAHPHIRIDGPKAACGISWPAGKSKTIALGQDSNRFWGTTLPSESTQLGWSSGRPALKLAFVPGGASSGVRRLEPPSPTAAATFIAVWADDPARFRRCQPGPGTTGQIRFDAGGGTPGPGSLVTGNVQAKDLECTDGTRVELNGQFRLVILDVR